MFENSDAEVSCFFLNNMLYLNRERDDGIFLYNLAQSRVETTNRCFSHARNVPFYLEVIMKQCIECGKEISRRAIKCKRCANKIRFLGKHHTIESKKKMSEAKKHQVFSKETRGKISNANIGVGNGRWKGGNRNWCYKMARIIYSEHHINIICEKCAFPNNINIHHKNKNWRDNRIENLQALCKSCHLSLHRKEFNYEAR